jgi:hypothetical protein
MALKVIGAGLGRTGTLTLPVPDAPFPRTNSREEFWIHAGSATPQT